jgi:uncharacterized protein YmfQ (DUF2313 family)
VALQNEAVAGLSSELLPDWEAMLNTPGPCATGSETEADRQAAAHAKMYAANQTQTLTWYVDFCAAYGIEVTASDTSSLSSPKVTSLLDSGSSTAALITTLDGGIGRNMTDARAYSNITLTIPTQTLR